MYGKTAVLAAIGDELLSGARQEGNCAFLAARLNEAGWNVERIEIISDDEFQIKAMLNRWVGRTDLLVMSGGLGPTHDDRTRYAIAGYLGCSLRSDALYDKILSRYASPESPEYNVERLKRLENSRSTQSMIPESAEAVYNPAGSALGITFKREGTQVLSLPGVPFEYRAMVSQELREIFTRKLRDYKVSSFIIINLPELEIVKRIPDVINNNKLHVSVLPSFPTVELIVKGETEEVDKAEAIIRGEFSDILPKECKNLAEAILYTGRALNKTVACAESCTGGLVQGAITDIAGSSDVFNGGVVTYSNEAKIKILGVSSEIINQFGAVSSECAEAMAIGALNLFNVDFAVSVTGIAGPDGGSETKPVGTVWFGICVRDNSNNKNNVMSFCRRLPGGRDEVRIRAVRYALAELWRTMNINNKL